MLRHTCAARLLSIYVPGQDLITINSNERNEVVRWAQLDSNI